MTASSVAVTSGPTGGCPVTTATLVKFAVTSVFVHSYEVSAPAASAPITFAQPGDRASVTVTAVSATSPVFLTVIVNVAVPPETTCWLSGFFVIEIAGSSTTTTASSVAVTSGPTGGCPVTTATLVKPTVTPVFVHSYEVSAPAASAPITFAQPGDRASVTVTSVSATSPVFLTVIVNVAVPPEITCWLSGFFVIEIAGWSTLTIASSV